MISCEFNLALCNPRTSRIFECGILNLRPVWIATLLSLEGAGA
jgi:hypothetical protein